MKKPVLFAALLLLVACQQRQGSNKAGTAKPDAQAAELPSGNLYNASAVNDFLATHPANDAGAKADYVKGVTAYRTEKNIAAAQKLFIQSLQQCPDDTTYFELGNADMDAKDYTGAVQAYAMADALHYQPAAKNLYNLACAYSRAGNASEAKKFLTKAIAAGYRNKQQIANDPDLAAARKDYDFAAKFQTGQTEQKPQPQPAALRAFLKDFKDAKFPFTLNAASGQRLLASINAGQGRYISYDYEKYVPEMIGQPRFSREPGVAFYCFGKVSATPQYTAVIYAFQNEGMQEDAPFAYTLATYDNSGKIIDKLYAGQRDAKSPYRVVTISAGLEITAKDYQQKWAKDPLREGYYENKVVSSALLRDARYHITEDGRIERDDAVVGLK